jgi:hypothetical protein
MINPTLCSAKLFSCIVVLKFNTFNAIKPLCLMF